MKEKIREFFGKMNNSYVIAAICVILIGVIFLGAMIGLVARPFSLNTTYYSTLKEEIFGEEFVVKSKLTLLEGGRYQLTQKSNLIDGSLTTFGDFGYGKVRIEDNKPRRNVIWFDNDKYDMVELTNPFKMEYDGEEFTNVGGILLLVCYCLTIAAAAAIATVLLIKRKDGGIVFTNKMRLIKRLKEIEEMIGK